MDGRLLYRKLVLTGMVAAALMSANVVVAQVVPSQYSSACFADQVTKSLERIRAIDLHVDQALREIADRGVKCFVVEQYTGVAETTHIRPRLLPVYIRVPGHRFSIDPSGGRWEDNSCNTWDTTLTHEIFHCWNRAMNGGWEPEPGPYGEREREVKAVRFENHFRRAAGICERTSYDGIPVPGEDKTCLRTEQQCPTSPSCRNDECCCFVYGGIKIPQPGGGVAWGACWIPRSTVEECDAQNVPLQSSAGCQASSACRAPEPHVPFCSGG